VDHSNAPGPCPIISWIACPPGPCWMIIQHEDVGCFPRCTCRRGPAASGDQVMHFLLFALPLLRCRSVREERKQHPTPSFSIRSHASAPSSRKRVMPEAMNDTYGGSILASHTSPIDHPLSPERFTCLPTVHNRASRVFFNFFSAQSKHLASEGFTVAHAPSPPSILASASTRPD
jgi:hypothetical protein